MISLTPAAARQIRQAAGMGEGGAVSLRIAARQLDDGTVEFGMGFDEPRNAVLYIDKPLKHESLGRHVLKVAVEARGHKSHDQSA